MLLLPLSCLYSYSMRSAFLVILLLLVVLPSCHTRRKMARRRERERMVMHTKERKGAEKPSSEKYTPESYIEKWKDVAIRQMRKHGIPASITLAQALLESSNGNSVLAREANNHFGIKCTSDWTGGTYYHDDDKSRDCFRKYRDASESFEDHTEFLKHKRYVGLFKLGSTDYRGWAKGLKNAGYATNPKYPELLINLIDKYHLDKYDR